MCKPGGGANRCFIHKMGTKSVILMTQLRTGGKIPETAIVQTAKDLRTEGKNLPTPSEREVQTFIDNEQFIVRNSDMIPENKRSMLNKRWDKAREEKPDGGTMHSWKHTPKESVNRWKRTLASIGLVSAISVTSACGIGSNEGNTTPAPAPTITQTQTTTPTTSPTASTTKPAPTTPTKTADPAREALKSAGFKVGKEKTNKNGKYQQIDVDSNNPMLREAWSGPKPAGWSKAELNKGQEVAASFFARNIVDSPFVGDPSYVSKFKKEITPEISRGGLNAGLLDVIQAKGNTPFLRDNYYQHNSGGPKGYRYVQDGGTRVVNPKFEVVKGSAYENFAEYQFNANYSMKATDNAGKKYLEQRSLQYTITVSTDDGPPKVAGMYSNSAMWAKPVEVK